MLVEVLASAEVEAYLVRATWATALGNRIMFDEWDEGKQRLITFLQFSYYFNSSRSELVLSSLLSLSSAYTTALDTSKVLQYTLPTLVTPSNLILPSLPFTQLQFVTPSTAH